MNEQAILDATKEFMGEEILKVYEVSAHILDFEGHYTDKQPTDDPSILIIARDVDNQRKSIGWNIRRYDKYTEREIGLMAGSAVMMVIGDRGMRTS